MRIFSVAIIGVVTVSILAVLYVAQHQAVDKAIQDEGNGIFHQRKREITAVRAAGAELFGDNLKPLKHGAYGETTGVSGPSRKNPLEEVIEDGVRAIKNLPTSVGHRTRPLPRLAAPGIYFTLLYLSVASPSGITGLKAGTLVACVKDNQGVILVTTGNLEFEAKWQYLTNDLDIADLASRHDAQAQQAVASSIAQQYAMHQARRGEENAAFEQRLREIAAKRATAAAEAPGYSNPLERGPYDQTEP
jgi:hypothetical protein